MVSQSRSAGPPAGVAVIGAGDHARVVASVLEAAGVVVAGHYDDDPETWGSSLGTSSVLGPIDDIPRRAPAIIAIGDNRVRQQLAQRLDLEWITVVHPFSWLHPDVRLGPGTVVCAGALVQVGVQIGAHVILNNRASVGHDARVGDYAHITVAHLGGGASAGEGALLGMGSVVLPRVAVGDWATVGAGATVTSDVRPGATVVGSPAREMTRQRRSGHSGGAPDPDSARLR
jgi:sugar O-acyltransferase (sialic acid O-acetyltransferase NeuD family)